MRLKATISATMLACTRAALVDGVIATNVVETPGRFDLCLLMLKGSDVRARIRVIGSRMQTNSSQSAELRQQQQRKRVSVTEQHTMNPERTFSPATQARRKSNCPHRAVLAISW